MPGRVVFIGDEIAAAGFRLAGVYARVPGPGEESACLREESAQAAFILLARGTAARIARPDLQRALASVSPLVLAVPDARDLLPASDVAARVRLQLGVGEA